MMRVAWANRWIAHLCISWADVVMPRHSIKTMPANATKRRKRVRVRKCRTALDGGSRALVDFQVTPPLGSSIVVKEEGRGWTDDTLFTTVVPPREILPACDVVQGRRC